MLVHFAKFQLYGQQPSISLVHMPCLSLLLLLQTSKEQAMQGQTYHFELNPIANQVLDILDDNTLESDSAELQLKYGFLKKCTSHADYKGLVATSQGRPVVINSLRECRNYSVNAGSEKRLFDNVRQNLQKFGKEYSENYELVVTREQDRYVYNCKDSSWQKINKSKLFKRQFDILSKSLLFRIDFSENLKKQNFTTDDIHSLIRKRREDEGVIRFKHIFRYQLHAYYFMNCSVVYQTEEAEQYARVKSILFDKGENISEDIAKIMTAEEVRQKKIKYEVELRFNEKGIDYMKKCKETELKTLLSLTFDFFRDLSNKIELKEEDLTKMMSEMKLSKHKVQQTNEKAGKGKQKKEESDEDQFISK